MNTLLIILSYTFHPFATHNYMQTHSILFRLFANIFFSLLIGMSWAFLGSYSLKEQINANSANRGDLSSRDSIENESVNHGSNESSINSAVLPIDNFDILMMVLPPIVSYLMAETFSISGLLAIMCCGFL
jgi:NhaP-type Na+/H+ or K+/H+ antiporter